MPPPKTRFRLLETSLYVADVARARQFYKDIMGFLPMEEGKLDTGASRSGGDFSALRFPDENEHAAILLLFAKGKFTQALTLSDGTIPPHGAEGCQHMAFAIAAADLVAWDAWLCTNNIKIESHQNWERGGRSIYFRDPDGHLLELITPGVWSVY